MTRVLTLCALTLMCSTGLALAAENPSGRPGKVLNDQQCQNAWQQAGAEDGSLSEAAATPYISNFQMVDKSNDRKISSDEWQAGCKAGWVSADARDVTAKDTAGSGGAKVEKANPSAGSTDTSKMMDENQSQ